MKSASLPCSQRLRYGMLGSSWTLPYQPIEKLASERCAWQPNKTPIFYTACYGQVLFFKF